MWCTQRVLLARSLGATPRRINQVLHGHPSILAHNMQRSSILPFVDILSCSRLPDCSTLQRNAHSLLVRGFASQRNKQRSAANATSATSTPSSPYSPPPPIPSSSSSYSDTPHSSLADSGRLIFATTLTLYARGVPYLFLFLLFPVVSYSIYATYAPSTAASAPPNAASYLSILPLTVLPLSFLLLFAAFVRFNRRLIATIHLLPDRHLALTTMNMLPASSSSPPNFILKPLDTLIPPYAWTGSQDRTLTRLRFVREGETGGVDEYWLYATPSKAGQQGVELLRRIMTDNRLSSRDLVT